MNARFHIAAIAETYRLRTKDLVGPSKEQRLCVPRRELFARLVCEPFRTGPDGKPMFRSLPQAGRVVGKRDHTTVLYGLRKFAAENLNLPPKAPLEVIRSAYLANLKTGEAA